MAAAPVPALAASDPPPDADPPFPVTIEHRFGETTIDEEPERVVSIGFGEHDGLLALGVTPIAVRDWYGDQPFATWPWALEALGDAEPAVLSSMELNFEEIAALDPDVIIGVSSGIDAEEYDTLSAIAPTLTGTSEHDDFATPWDERLRLTALAVGRSDAEGREIVADQLLAGAFSHASPLSLEYVLDELVPELVLAVDGDPETPVPSASAIEP